MQKRVQLKAWIRNEARDLVLLMTQEATPRLLVVSADMLTFSQPFVGAWRSLVARLLWEQEVGGSNPSAPTTLIPFIAIN